VDNALGSDFEVEILVREMADPADPSHGQVVEQQPVAGTEVDLGSAVTVVFANAPQAPQADFDGDGITNATDTDDDDDGYLDIEETDAASDPFDADETPQSPATDFDGDGTPNSADTDDDGDGFSDTQESDTSSDPFDDANTPESDNDNDGFSNLEETTAGTDPNDADDTPAPPTTAAPTSTSSTLAP